MKPKIRIRYSRRFGWMRDPKRFVCGQRVFVTQRGHHIAVYANNDECPIGTHE
jgi:hypothetical protein